jgi:5'-3' exonuclease
VTDWAVLDVSNLLWWIFHSTGRKDPTLSLVTFLTKIPSLCNDLGCESVTFACDEQPYKRSTILPGYKSHRTKPFSEDSDAEDELRAYIGKCPDYLRLLGYKNVVSQRGYEADDVMAETARVVSATIPRSRVVLVSGDQDLYQCLTPHVCVYHPRKPGGWVTSRWFRDAYGIPPRQWVEVKCVAGCVGDHIPGVDGVAELTALKFFRGELSDGVLYQRIRLFNHSPEYARNRRLIALPFPGLDPITVERDSPRPMNGYKPLADKLGVEIDDPVGRRRLLTADAGD